MANVASPASELSTMDIKVTAKVAIGVGRARFVGMLSRGALGQILARFRAALADGRPLADHEGGGAELGSKHGA
jgi:hypothetical protein